MLEASTPTTKTLRPCVEESKDWENTKNLYIEGDNLEALKILQNTYGGKVKMIYIDPPYNTGHDFIYHDNFHGTRQEELIKEGVVDAETGERFKMNSESNGHFHSDWCSMMYPRLKLARNLLRDDGVLFMSIDDNEVVNARKLCDEVFGEGNYIETLKWKRKKQPSFLAKHTARMMEYILVYGVEYDKLEKLSIEGTSDSTKKVVNLTNNMSIRKFKKGLRVKLGEEGVIKAGKYTVKTMTVEYLSDVEYKNGRTISDVDVVAQFSTTQENIDMFIDNDLLFITSQYGLRRDVSLEEQGKRKSITDLLLTDWGDNQESDNEQSNIFEKKLFDYSKPTRLVFNLSKSLSEKDVIILDFFSGSATTAHAVMKLNAEDGGNRKFVMVQLPEVCAEGSEAAKAGYKNICEIGKERIRRAGEKIKEELAAKDAKSAKSGDLDTGFRVFKVDSSNMDDIYFQPMNVQQQDLIRAINNVKTNRTALDLLFGCLLEWGLPIDLPVKERKDLGSNTFEVDNGRIIAAFDSNITESTVRSIANEQPDFAIFRDQCFYDSASKINVREIFKTLSPNTKLKVL